MRPGRQGPCAFLYFKNATDGEICSDGNFGWVETCIRRRFGDYPAHQFDDPEWSNNYCVCEEDAFRQLIAQKAQAEWS